MSDTETEDRHGIEPDETLRDLDHEPSAQSLLEQLGRAMGGDMEGWAGIDGSSGALHRQRQESAAAIRKEAAVFRDTFATADGQKCLQLMIDQTLRAQPYPVDAMLPMDAITPLVIAHNAQCNFVWAILEAIAQAENRPATPRN